MWPAQRSTTPKPVVIPKASGLTLRALLTEVDKQGGGQDKLDSWVLRSRDGAQLKARPADRHSVWGSHFSDKSRTEHQAQAVTLLERVVAQTYGEDHSGAQALIRIYLDKQKKPVITVQDLRVMVSQADIDARKLMKGSLAVVQPGLDAKQVSLGSHNRSPFMHLAGEDDEEAAPPSFQTITLHRAPVASADQPVGSAVAPAAETPVGAGAGLPEPRAGTTGQGK